MAKRKLQGVDSVTREWIRNRSDELAVKAGYRFDLERAEFAREWIERYCRLYEGEYAGQPLELRDWAHEAVMRLFGWVGWNEDRQRELRRFTKGSIWVSKKNKKSPTLAAIGLYLLCGDGEQGQKVYSVARDGKQAMIAHQHAMEMVWASPELSAECSVNKATGRITHNPTRSFYMVVSGDNINSQEGLNGSILVDETHVVDWRLMKVLRYAGISRAEPLQLSASSAGNNPDGYGKDQFDYGAQVERGEVVNHQYFYLAHAAPQDLSDEELDRDPVKYGKMANPAWGHTVKESEFLSSYQEAKRSIAELADFKMYRLTIWQRASNPWLRQGDWQACRREFTADDLEGQECWAGLDMSRTRDMTAFVLVFRGDEAGAWRVLAWFWLPEAAARERSHLAPFMDWAAGGHLILTPGDVIDYGYVKATIRKQIERYRVQELGYDRVFANELTQSLEQGETDDAGRVTVEGTGTPRLEVPQTPIQLTPVITEIERLVVDHKLHHNGHPVLSWQAGHVSCKQAANRLMQLVKPSGKDDIRKIDGFAALCNAMFCALRNTGQKSVYDDRGILSI